VGTAIAAVQGQFDADRRARYAGQPRAMIPVVAQDPLAPCALPTPDSWQWFTETGKSRASAWRNEVTLQSVEMFDADRIGVWGSSYSGAHVVVLGATDRRVKCVVAQVPLISGHRNARRLIRSDFDRGESVGHHDRGHPAGNPVGQVQPAAQRHTVLGLERNVFTHGKFLLSPLERAIDGAPSG
jgi:hypothetical protein